MNTAGDAPVPLTVAAPFEGEVATLQARTSDASESVAEREGENHPLGTPSSLMVAETLHPDQ